MTNPIITLPVVGRSYKFMTYLAYDKEFLCTIANLNKEALKELQENTSKYLYTPLYLQHGKDGCDAVFKSGGNGADGDGIAVNFEALTTAPSSKFGRHVHGYFLKANDLYLYLSKDCRLKWTSIKTYLPVRIDHWIMYSFGRLTYDICIGETKVKHQAMIAMKPIPVTLYDINNRQKFVSYNDIPLFKGKPRILIDYLDAQDAPLIRGGKISNR